MIVQALEVFDGSLWVMSGSVRLRREAGSLGRVRESIGKVLDLSPKRIYVGHGGPLTPGAVRRWFS